MDKKKLLMMGAAIVTLSPMVMRDANAATGTGKMEAEIIQAITVKGTATLDFGQMTTGGAGGTMKMSVAGARTPTGVVALGAAGGAGSILVTAAKGFPIDLSVTATKFNVTHTLTATKKMTVDTFVIKGKGAGGTKTTVTVAAGTTVKAPVGATLNVAAGQQAGVYKGTYTVSAAYQ